MRERLPGEVPAILAEQSATLHGREDVNSANNAIDLNLDSMSYSAEGPGGIWIELTLDDIYCVDKVVQLDWEGDPLLIWTCTSTECFCVGLDACDYTVTVTTKGNLTGDHTPLPDCKYGDTVKMLRTDSLLTFQVRELAIIGQQGEIKYWCVRYIPHKNKYISRFLSQPSLYNKVLFIVSWVTYCKFLCKFCTLQQLLLICLISSRIRFHWENFLSSLIS